MINEFVLYNDKGGKVTPIMWLHGSKLPMISVYSIKKQPSS